MVVENYPGGDPVVILGSDGTNLHALLADALHRLVVAVGATVMDPLAATELTLAAVLAQLDVALSTRALEAGGNLAAIHARLDAIQITRGTIVRFSRGGVLASGAGWTTCVNIAVKGVLLGLDFSSDYKVSQLGLRVNGQYVGTLKEDGSGTDFPSAESLNNIGGESTFLKENVYDDTNDHYHFSLKREIHYNTGLIVEIRQNSGANKNIALYVHYQPEV